MCIRDRFEAASEPKEIRWWDAGHRLPAGASAEVAEWLQRTLGPDEARDSA